MPQEDWSFWIRLAAFTAIELILKIIQPKL